MGLPKPRCLGLAGALRAGESPSIPALPTSAAGTHSGRRAPWGSRSPGFHEPLVKRSGAGRSGFTKSKIPGLGVFSARYSKAGWRAKGLNRLLKVETEVCD